MIDEPLMRARIYSPDYIEDDRLDMEYIPPTPNVFRFNSDTGKIEIKTKFHSWAPIVSQNPPSQTYNKNESAHMDPDYGYMRDIVLYEDDTKADVNIRPYVGFDHNFFIEYTVISEGTRDISWDFMAVEGNPKAVLLEKQVINFPLFSVEPVTTGRMVTKFWFFIDNSETWFSDSSWTFTFTSENPERKIVRVETDVTMN